MLSAFATILKKEMPASTRLSLSAVFPDSNSMTPHPIFSSAVSRSQTQASPRLSPLQMLTDALLLKFKIVLAEP
jgi:hypothetical protein